MLLLLVCKRNFITTLVGYWNLSISNVSCTWKKVPGSPAVVAPTRDGEDLCQWLGEWASCACVQLLRQPCCRRCSRVSEASHCASVGLTCLPSGSSCIQPRPFSQPCWPQCSRAPHSPFWGSQALCHCHCRCVLRAAAGGTGAGGSCGPLQPGQGLLAFGSQHPLNRRASSCHLES